MRKDLSVLLALLALANGQALVDCSCPCVPHSKRLKPSKEETANQARKKGKIHRNSERPFKEWTEQEQQEGRGPRQTTGIIETEQIIMNVNANFETYSLPNGIN